MKRFIGMFAIALCVVLTGCPDSKGNPTETKVNSVVGTWERVVIKQWLGDSSKAYITFEPNGENGNWKFNESHTSGEYSAGGTYTVTPDPAEAGKDIVVITVITSNHPKLRVGYSYKGHFYPVADSLYVPIDGLHNTAYSWYWTRFK